MDFKQISMSDGSWNELVSQWSLLCDKYQEDFSDYKNSYLDVMESLVTSPKSDAGIFAIHDNGNYKAICQLNATFLPGYTGKVLRVRMIVVSPEYDFEDKTSDEYAGVISSIFENVISASDNIYKSEHIKFHFRSPNDKMYFTIFGKHLSRHTIYKNVEMRGMWMYITK